MGASKIGGLPDLPRGYVWPPGGDCHAIYNDDCGGTSRLAGFLAQVNLDSIAHTQAGASLPESGLLSFFCFQDWENDNPDAVGVKAIYFKDTSTLTRTNPPGKLTEGNQTMPARRLEFEETLDLPYGSQYTTPDEGPWGAEILPVKDIYRTVYSDDIYEANMENMLGYARATSGADPTPDKESRHLILLDNASGCRLHIQIPEKQLAARNFDAITLNWVDFD